MDDEEEREEREVREVREERGTDGRLSGVRVHAFPSTWFIDPSIDPAPGSPSPGPGALSAERLVSAPIELSTHRSD